MQTEIGIGNSGFQESREPRFTEEPIKVFETFQEIAVRNEKGTFRTDLGRPGTRCSDSPVLPQLDRPLLDIIQFLSNGEFTHRLEISQLNGQ